MPSSHGAGHGDIQFIKVGGWKNRSNSEGRFESVASVPSRPVKDNDNERQQNTNENQISQPLCIVCKQRPQYSKDGVKYSTCGLTCGQKLEPSLKPMCCVCGVRPCYFNGSKQFRTCGNECAEKLKLKDCEMSGRLCDYCHQRPKYHDGTKIYPQCSKICRDNARQEMASREIEELSRPSAPSKTNSACLLCWSAQMTPGSDLCNLCIKTAEKVSLGLLLNVPRGHATFNDVATQFTTAWKSKAQCPDIFEMYKILEPCESTARFSSYQHKIDPNGHSTASKGIKTRRWHGTTRECSGYDPGNLDICPSTSCLLCSTIRTSFDLKIFPSGIYTSSTSSQSNIHCGSSGEKNSALLVDVVVENPIDLSPDKNPHGAGPGYDAINLVGYTSSGRRVEYDELITYNKNSIKPLYVVVYG